LHKVRCFFRNPECKCEKLILYFCKILKTGPIHIIFIEMAPVPVSALATSNPLLSSLKSSAHTLDPILGNVGLEAIDWVGYPPSVPINVPGPASRLFGKWILVVYDQGYRDPTTQADLCVPLTHLSGSSERISTWILPPLDVDQARKLAHEMIEHVNSHVPSITPGKDHEDVVIMLHSDIPPGQPMGTKFHTLRYALEDYFAGSDGNMWCNFLVRLSIDA
jgi:hypothetical protein